MKNRHPWTAVALASALCVISLAASAASPGTVARGKWTPVATESLATDRVIVKYRDDSGGLQSPRSNFAARVAANRQGVGIGKLRQMRNGAQVMQLSKRISVEEVETLLESMRSADPSIEYAEPDRILHTMATTNDTLLPQQWFLTDTVGGIRAPTAWDRSTGRGVVVAAESSHALAVGGGFANKRGRRKRWWWRRRYGRRTARWGV